MTFQDRLLVVLAKGGEQVRGLAQTRFDERGLTTTDVEQAANGYGWKPSAIQRSKSAS